MYKFRYGLKTLLSVAFVMAASGMAGVQLGLLWDNLTERNDAAIPETVVARSPQQAVRKSRTNAEPGKRRQAYLHAAGDGHFYVDIRLGKHKVTMLIDTGTDLVALPYETALAAGLLHPGTGFDAHKRTANGLGRFARVRIGNLKIGDIVLRDVQAYVAQPGRLKTALLGLAVLGRLQKVDMRGEHLTLLQ